MPGQYSAAPNEEAANNVRSGRIPQCVPRSYKSPKCVERVCYSTRLRIKLTGPTCLHAPVQALPRRLCASLFDLTCSVLSRATSSSRSLS